MRSRPSTETETAGSGISVLPSRALLGSSLEHRNGGREVGLGGGARIALEAGRAARSRRGAHRVPIGLGAVGVCSCLIGRNLANPRRDFARTISRTCFVVTHVP